MTPGNNSQKVAIYKAMNEENKRSRMLQASLLDACSKQIDRIMTTFSEDLKCVFKNYRNQRTSEMDNHLQIIDGLILQLQNIDCNNNEVEKEADDVIL